MSDTTAPGRFCKACGATLMRRKGEPPSRFAARRTCGRRCACSLPKKGADYREAALGHETPCWIWTKTRSANGYGRARRGGRFHQAHRLIYELLVGPIPEGLHLDHLCRVRACVNPAHLEPVTQAENNRRSREALT